MERCQREEMQQVVLVAKKIWARRNMVVHEGDFSPLNRIVREAKLLLQCLITVLEEKENGVAQRCENDPMKWERPPFGRFKVNWDVAIDKHLQCMGFGIIIRDYHGCVCATKSMRVNGTQVPAMGEAMAALAAVEFSKERDIQDVILEGDSLQVVQAMKEQDSNWRTYGHILDDDRTILGT